MSTPKPTWLDEGLVIRKYDGTEMPRRSRVRLVGPDEAISDDAAAGETVLDLASVWGTRRYDVASTSAPLVAGDCVCLAVGTDGKITKAVLAALVTAGAVLGIVTAAASPGGVATVQLDSTLSPAITGLAGFGPVRVNTTTARPEIVTQFSGSDYPLGFCLADGWLTMVRGIVVSPDNPLDFASLGGLVGDYDADSIAGTTGASIAQWNDASASAQHLTQSTGANQPTLLVDAINGKNAVRFDGSNDNLHKAGFTLGTNEITVAIVSRLNAVGNVQYNYWDGGTTVVQRGQNGANGEPKLSRGAGGVALVGHDSTGDGFAIDIAQCRSDGLNQFWYQGTLVGTFNDSALVESSARLDVGSYYNEAAFWCRTDIARLLVWNHRHSTSDIIRIHNRLADIYALPHAP